MPLLQTELGEVELTGPARNYVEEFDISVDVLAYWHVHIKNRPIGEKIVLDQIRQFYTSNGEAAVDAHKAERPVEPVIDHYTGEEVEDHVLGGIAELSGERGLIGVWVQKRFGVLAPAELQTRIIDALYRQGVFPAQENATLMHGIICQVITQEAELIRSTAERVGAQIPNDDNRDLFIKGVDCSRVYKHIPDVYRKGIERFLSRHGLHQVYQIAEVRQFLVIEKALRKILDLKSPSALMGAS